MNISPVIMLIGAALMNASGTAVMKYAMMYKKLEHPSTILFWAMMMAAMTLYGACFPIFASALARTRLSIGQPVFSATGFVASTLFSLLVFKESISLGQFAGLAAIVIGIVLVVR